MSVETKEAKRMASQQITKKLVKHIDEGVAMEQNVLRMLDSMIKTTQDPETLKALEQHKLTTRKHAQRLEERLKMHGTSPSRTRRVTGIVAARLKGVVDVARSDKPARNARDGFVTEQLEVASYELLERVARRAGDEATAEVARQNRAEDQAMAQRLADDWDKFADLSLAGSGSSSGGGGGKVRALRGRATRLGSAAGQNPLVVGAGTVAAGFLVGRRLQSGGGGEQQKQQSGGQPRLELMTKKELQELAEAQGIEVRRNMKKQELVDALRRPAANPSEAKANPFEVQNFLADVSYPTSRDALVREAQRHGADERVRSTLDRLPRRRFNTPAEVSEAIGELP